MDAIELLEMQHREVEKLFKALEAAESPAEKLKVFETLADALGAHGKIEEAIFYPAVKTRQTEELLKEAVEEHLSVKRIIADAMALEPENEQFMAKCTVLQEQIEHHVEEEEEEMFKKVRGLFTAEELTVMGEQMANLYADLMAKGEPRQAVPAETGEAAPI